MMTNNAAILPWYRYPLVWMVVTIPFSAIVMGVIMIWLAVTTDDGLVADDYYKQGMAINRNIHRDVTAQELGIGATLKMQNAPGGWLWLSLNKGGLEEFPESLQLKLQYATQDDNDVQLELNRGQGDQYTSMLKRPLIQGKWYLELSAGEWRLNGNMYVNGQGEISLDL